MAYKCPNFRERHKSSAVVCYTEFHQNPSINAESHLHPHLLYRQLAHTAVYKHFFTEIHGTPTNNSMADTVSYTEGRGLHIRHSYSLCEERLTPVHS